MAEAVTTSATDFKRHVGKYLDVARTGAVVIEKQGRPTAVLISVEEYAALNPSASPVIKGTNDRGPGANGIREGPKGLPERASV